MNYCYVLFNKEHCDQGWHQFYRTPVLQRKTSPVTNILGKHIAQKLQCLQKHETIKFLPEICISSIFILFCRGIT